MKRLIINAFSCMIFFIILLTPAISSQILYVTSEDATLKAEKSSSSATISELRRGSALTQISKEGRWYQVKTPAGETGWIYRGKVSAEKPEIDESGEDEEEGLGGLLGDLSGSDIDADAADSSRSIRGLSPEAKEYAKNTGSTQESQDALDSVLARTTAPEDIDQFLKAGKVGEYAE
jgi:uncharacterized protein YgiM (DUF1202 family)